MENCERILDLLNAYIDGELDVSESERVRAHIEKCESCKKIYDELVKVNKMLANSAEDAPTEILDGVMKKIKSEKRGKIINFRKISGVAVAAVILLAVVSSPLVGRIANGGDVKLECADKAENFAPSMDAKDDYIYSDSYSGGLDGIKDVVESVVVPAEREEPEKIVEETVDCALPLEFGVGYQNKMLNGERVTVVFEGGVAILDGEKYEYKYNGEVYILSNSGGTLNLKPYCDDESLWFEQTESEND